MEIEAETKAFCEFERRNIVYRDIINVRKYVFFINYKKRFQVKDIILAYQSD